MKFKLKALTVASLLTVSSFALGGSTTQNVIEQYNTTITPVSQSDFYDYYQLEAGQRFQLMGGGTNGAYYLGASEDSIYTRNQGGAGLTGSKWSHWIDVDWFFSDPANMNNGFSLSSQTTSTITQRYPGNPVSTQYTYSTLENYDGKGLQYQTTIATSGANEVLKQEILFTNQETAFTTNPAANQQMTSVPLTRVVFDEQTGLVNLYQYHSKNGDVNGQEFVILHPEAAGTEIYVDADGMQVDGPGTGVTTQYKVETALDDGNNVATLVPFFGNKIAYPKTLSSRTPEVVIDENGDLKVYIFVDDAIWNPIGGEGISIQSFDNLNWGVNGTDWEADPRRATGYYVSTITSAQLTTLANNFTQDGDTNNFVIGANNENGFDYVVNNLSLTRNATGAATTKIIGDQDGFGTNSSSNSGMSAGAITGIVIGSIAAVGLGAWFVNSRRKSKLK